MRMKAKVASLTRDIYGNTEDKVEREVQRIISKKLGGICKLEQAILNQRRFAQGDLVSRTVKNEN